MLVFYLDYQKINKSNTKVSTHKLAFYEYLHILIIFLLPVNFYISFFWNVINSRTIKIYHINTIHIQSYLMNSCWFVFIKNHYRCPTLCLKVNSLLNKHIQIWVHFFYFFIFIFFFLFFYFKINQRMMQQLFCPTLVVPHPL